MISIVQQTLDFYLSKMSVPDITEITLANEELASTKWSCFVTLFLKWEVRWSAGNIKDVLGSIAEELIANTIQAISKDSRFSPLTIWEKNDIKLRVDFIKNRKVVSRTPEQAKDWIETLARIDPIKNWVIVIKKDYSKTATILPNIDPKVVSGNDYQDILSAKLEEQFEEDKYIIYEIETIVERDY